MAAVNGTWGQMGIRGSRAQLTTDMLGREYDDAHHDEDDENDDEDDDADHDEDDDENYDKDDDDDC